MQKPPEYGYPVKSPKLDRILTVAVMVVAAMIILFPLFVREKSTVRDAGCANNLRQIGQAMKLYSADYDDRFPAGIDPSDKFIPAMWSAQPKRAAVIKKLPLLQDILKRYVKTPGVFRCPLDTGGELMDVANQPFHTAPSMFANYGTSYIFRTEIVFKSMVQKDYWPPQYIGMLYDGYGHWHGNVDPVTPATGEAKTGYLVKKFRYNALFGDLHVEMLGNDEYQATWRRQL